MTKEKIIGELSEKLSLIPGYVSGFLPPIENRILMTLGRAKFLPGKGQKTLGESRKMAIVAADARPLCLCHCHFRVFSLRR
jgi:hypothetical protein